MPSEIEHKYLVLKKRGSPQPLGFYIGRDICHLLKNALFESGSQETERI